MSEPKPGEMHPVDRAFYELAIKERNFERQKVDRLEAEIKVLQQVLDRLQAEINQMREAS